MIYTDHQSLVSGYISYLKGQSKGLLYRWYATLSQYLPNLTFEYKPGKSNEAAETLSRTPIRTCMVLQVVTSYPEEALLHNICIQQSEDKEIVNIKNYLEKKVLPSNDKEAKHVATVAKKVLCT